MNDLIEGVPVGLPIFFVVWSTRWNVSSDKVGRALSSSNCYYNVSVVDLVYRFDERDKLGTNTNSNSCTFS